MKNEINNMIKFYITLCFVLFVSSSFAQEIKNFGRSEPLQGNGVIGTNMEITIYLDVISRLDYNKNGFRSKYYNQIIGLYTYVKYGGSIQLVGQQVKSIADDNGLWMDGYNPDSLVLYELNDRFEKTAEFRGILKQNIFSGTWVNLKNKKENPFKIVFDFNSESVYTSLSTIFEKKYVPLYQLDVNSGQGTFELIKRIEKNNTLYLVIQNTEPFCESFNARGYGCGALNIYLSVYKISQNRQEINRELVETHHPSREIIKTTSTKDAYSLTIQEIDGIDGESSE
jgi:hypothetical protein